VATHSEYHPRERTGKECNQKYCARHNDYLSWSTGNSSLKFCRECRFAHVSQYKRKNIIKEDTI